MKIERYQAQGQSKSTWRLACGCLGLGGLSIIVTGIIASIVFPLLPELILPSFGLESVGDTEEILNATPQAIPSFIDEQTVGSVTLSSGSYSQVFSGSGAGYIVIVGQTENNIASQMQVEFTEAGLLGQCQLLTPICSSQSDTIRNARFDFRAGGLVINGEFELQPGLWQAAGLVVRASENENFDIIGVEINGSVFAPTSSDLATIVSEVESRTNLFLEQITAQAGANTYRLDDIIIDETTLTLILR